jgi:iron complex outermembrane receptor protein
MTKSKSRTPAQAALWRATPVATAIAALWCGPGVALAQQAPAAGEPQTVTITGIRRGIESAISVKKNADGVVEAISAEDIGKLPDTTIAESLARLPGVTTQRDRNGNATNITIRGLGPDFNGYLLNGREQTSTGDSRAVDLSVYPAELIGGATVYKTGDASLAAAGLAGTIDNKLIDPLSFGGRVIAGTVGKTRTGVGLDVTGKGKRYSLSYIDQFANRTIGVAVGFVHSDGDSSSLANGSWGNTSKVTTTGGVTANYDIPFGGGLSYETDVNKDKRDGIAAILSYKPNKNFSTQLDVYTAKIKTSTKKNAVKGGTFGGDVTNATVSGTTVTAGTINMGATPGSQLIGYSENLFDDDKIDSLGWNAKLKFGDGWTASVDINSNKAKRVEKDIEAYAGITTADTLSFTNNGGIPQFKLGNPGAYTNPATMQVRDQSGWSGVSYPTGSPFAGQTVPQAGYSKGPTIVDKLDALRFDFKKDLGDAGFGLFTDVQFGLNYSKRSKDRTTDEGLIVASGANPYARIPMPGDAYVVNNIGGTGLAMLTFDPQDGLWPGATIQRKFNDDILSKTWGVTEKITTAYGKLNIDTTLMGLPTTGNVGVQIVGTDQSSAGYRSSATSNVTLTNPAGALVRNGTTYTDFLPSLNLRSDLGDGNVLRFGLSKQIARPTLTDMRNSFGIGIDNQTGLLTASSGNPNLKPFKATALDFSYEKYFANKAYVSAAAFYKKLDTYIVQSTLITDLSALARQYGVNVPTAGGIGKYTTTVNGSGGNIRGIELAASLPFNMLTSWLDGFGATGSVSSTQSSIELPFLIGLNPTQQVTNLSVKMQLPGLSKTNTKLMLYYERYGFSAFVAQNKRSKYIGSVANSTVGGYPALAQIDPQTWVSAQVGYEFQDGFLKGLGLRFEGNNMNKPVYREFNGSNTNENRTGATYGLKVTYKYQ